MSRESDGMRLPEQRDDAGDVRAGHRGAAPVVPGVRRVAGWSEDRTFTPGAEMSGLMRFEPSSVTGPRLLKPASETGLPVYVVAPVEYEAS